MSYLSLSFARVVAVTVLVSSIGFAHPLKAASDDQPVPTQQTATNETSLTLSSGQESGRQKSKNSGEMKKHVEHRIKTLHEKLGITNAQEAKWSDVAQVMRDNEAAMNQLVVQRHQNHEHMTVIEDLQSYQTIAQAHADGIKKMIPVFQTLYNDMNDEQKKKADKIFGRFEGHQTGKKHK